MLDKITCTETALRELIEETVVALDDENLFDEDQEVLAEAKATGVEQGLVDAAKLMNWATVRLLNSAKIASDLLREPMSVVNFATALDELAGKLEDLSDAAQNFVLNGDLPEDAN